MKNVTWKQILVLSAAALLFVGFVVFFATGMKTQRDKLRDLQQERWELENKIDELTREQERLQSDLEFAKSLEGLLQYARDHLGYVEPGDIRIEDNE